MFFFCRLIFVGPSLDKLASDSKRKKRSIKETVLVESGQFLFSSAFANFIVDINQESIVDNIEVVQEGFYYKCSFYSFFMLEDTYKCLCEANV